MGLTDEAPKLLFHGIVNEKTGKFIPDKIGWFQELSKYKG